MQGLGWNVVVSRSSFPVKPVTILYKAERLNKRYEFTSMVLVMTACDF